MKLMYIDNEAPWERMLSA